MNLDVACITALASFGATYIIRYQDGPLHVFHRLRTLSGIEYVPVLDDAGIMIGCVEEIPDGFFAGLLGCHWCLGTWVSGFFATLLVLLQYTTVGDWVFYWLMFSGVVGFLCDILRSSYGQNQ